MNSISPSALSSPIGERQAVGQWAELTEFMRRQPAWISIITPMLLTIGMGWMDDISGWEVSLFIFYAVPIILAVWWVNVSSGLIVAILSGLIWWYANRDVHPYETHLGYAWALMNREFYFGVVVFAVNIVRKKQDADAAHIQMLEERQQLEKDIVTVSEYEQQRIGRDLHDGLCQQLAAIGCAARALTEDMQSKGYDNAPDAAAIEECIQQAVIEARDMARGIFPVHVDRSGLSTALRDLAQTTARLTGIDIETVETNEVQLHSPEVSMHLFRITQEAVANAVRHASASKIWIKLDLRGDVLTLQIEDDGRGMGHHRVPSKGGGMGLRTMRYRAQAIGATLHIEPRLGGGTRVRCQMKIEIVPATQHSHA
jgi:signal transduction histidine kinase